MKRIWLLAVMCMTFIPALAQSELQQAEELYRQGKFSAALNAYETILKNHPNDPFVYYNIGNCYFKIGSKGLAAANYYRAFKLDPRDNDIRHNLALTLQSSGERLVPSGMPVVLHKAFFYLSDTELKGLVYALFWLFSVLVFLCLIRRKWNGITTVVSVLLILGTGWLYLRQQTAEKSLAVIASPVAEIRSGPGLNFPASANASQGHLVTILDGKDAWYEVIVNSQGIKGWIEKDTVEKI